MTCRFLIGLAIACFGFAGSALADMNYLSAPETTKFTGKGGASHTLAPAAGVNATVSSIVAREKSDDPCHLEVGFSEINTGADAGVAVFAECGGSNGKGTGQSQKTIGGSSVLKENYYAIGTRICHNKGGDKLKGMALIYQRKDCFLGADSFTVKADECQAVSISGHDYTLCADTVPRTIQCSSPQAFTTHWFERTNCVGSNRGPDNDWKREVRCPDGKVATAVKLSTRDGGGNRRMIDGVALDCRKIGIGSFAVRPK